MACGGKKNVETSSAATTADVDPQIRILLETIQKQNGKHEKQMSEMRQALRAANEENKKRVREIEVLGRSLAGMQLGEDTILTDVFTSVISHNDIAGTVRKTGVPPKEPPLLPKDLPSDEELAPTRPTEQPYLRAKDAIRYIPTLNGDDDIGVEDFIKEVRSLCSICTEQSLLLKAIKVEKIVGKAAQSIRNISIENYADLYDALRNNVAVQASADEFNEQLRELKQGNTESIQSFNIRFRRVLNKLTYAITNEYPQPITRRVMMEATMRRVTKIYINGLKREISHMIFTSKPKTLVEAEKEAADVERYLREERHGQYRRPRETIKRYGTKRPDTTRYVERPAGRIDQNRLPRPVAVLPSRPTQSELRPLQARIKCFKCGQLGHTSNQCTNFRTPGPQNKPPPRVNKVTTEDEYELMQPQEIYQQSYLDQKENPNNDFLSTQEQKLTSSEDTQ